MPEPSWAHQKKSHVNKNNSLSNTNYNIHHPIFSFEKCRRIDVIFARLLLALKPLVPQEKSPSNNFPMTSEKVHNLRVVPSYLWPPSAPWWRSHGRACGWCPSWRLHGGGWAGSGTTPGWQPRPGSLPPPRLGSPCTAHALCTGSRPVDRTHHPSGGWEGNCNLLWKINSLNEYLLRYLFVCLLNIKKDNLC